MKLLICLLGSSLALAGCSKRASSVREDAATEPPSGSLPVCDSAERAKQLDGQQVRLVGTYVPVATPKKMPAPGEPPDDALRGKVVIEIDGPAHIELGKGYRPPEEIESLRGRRISVEGRLVLAPPSPPDVATTMPQPTLFDPVRLVATP